MPYLIGVDCSTQSTKAIVYDPLGRELARGRTQLGYASPHPGWAEQDPDEWVALTLEALAQAVAGLRTAGGDPDDITAMGLAWQRETFVALDDDGRPLRPAVLWLDQRAAREAEVARKKFGAERFLRITGKQLDTTPSFSKLLWLRRHEPDLYARLGRILDVGGYLTRGLCGVARTSLVGADSLCLMDLAAGAWSAEILDYLGLRADALPEVVAPGALLGHLSPSAAERCGLPAGLPVVAAGGDGQVFALGAGALDAATLSLTVGTSLVLGAHWPGYRVGPAWRTMAGCLPGTYLLEAVLRAGAGVVSWFVREMAPGRREAELDVEIASIPPGCLGLLTVPYWKGRMVPSNEPLARGVTAGWSDYHTQAHFYRSILEGIAFEVRLLVEAFADELDVAPTSIRLGGGGALSRVWPGIMADVTGLSVALTPDEATALGAAMLAAAHVGIHPSPEAAVAAMCHLGDEIRPDEARARAYDRIYSDYYAQLYPLLRPLLVALGRGVLEGEWGGGGKP